MLRYILLNNFQNSNRYTEWTRQDLLAFIFGPVWSTPEAYRYLLLQKNREIKFEEKKE